jgi:hypothetical protein
LRLAAAALLVAACGRGEPAKPTSEVEGTVTLDGQPRVVTRCEVTAAPRGVHLRLHLAGGTVVTYAEAERVVLVGPDPYRCTSGAARDIRWGTPPGGGFFHGGLAFGCARGESRVDADLTLRCGVLDDATRRDLETEIEKAKSQQGEAPAQ